MDKQTPCGNCDMSIYVADCLVAAAEFCLGKQTRKEALRNAPRCQCDSNKICMGARDFIICQPFPFTESDHKKILDSLD